MKIIKEKNPIAYVYCIHNKTNNKRYVGQTNVYKVRAAQHLKHLKKGIHYVTALQKDYDKGDVLECSILEVCIITISWLKKKLG